MADPLNKFQIDGSDVAGMDIDSRHQLMPGEKSALRLEHFPGSRTRFAIKGQRFYGRIVVSGHLRAATPDAFYLLLEQHAAAAASAALVSVTLHGSTFNDCDLVEFRQIDPEITAYRGLNAAGVDTEGVKARVMFVFERLAA